MTWLIRVYRWLVTTRLGVLEITTRLRQRDLIEQQARHDFNEEQRKLDDVLLRIADAAKRYREDRAKHAQRKRL